MTAAFASTVTSRQPLGTTILVTGTFASSGGATGGEVLTGLRRVLSFHLQKAGAAVDVSQYAANETLPADTGDITIVTTADTSGVWTAIGTE